MFSSKIQLPAACGTPCSATSATSATSSADILSRPVTITSVNPRTGTVYLAGDQDSAVSVIHGQANKVIATILTGNRQNGPNRTEGIAVSPLNGDAYAVNSAGYGLWVIAD
jgi:DNA-binding beta-propeller fold protein YncE